MVEKNYMKLEFLSKSNNESFARVVVAAFASQLDPTLEELSDIKTAVSEAVTNAIIHGYEYGEGIVIVESKIEGNEIEIIVEDRGMGILDIDKAREPFYTSKPNLERSGMGFTVMETFMDSLEVQSIKGKGTTVKMTKKFKSLLDKE
ncbi:anti-sigma F factor [Tissierella praeacuta]|uniref:Stage II sporulation protein AB (Anti-sigma F factor) n=1 Tax=Tissierella praeacuta DSM 18095 TaxID=1123404 RepID=A0A1M4SXF0_9FIRM|nr:anti-sigma F factor [Tissierella praeacuta]MBU5254593.1 anti-sigma F factor [Tissierella praeacuta]TCU70745.1 stage II sporulation protein AB (anti-sigma F factor) [Tissierella praeacuta]SHE36883.1 stage II sporulation protein AB (anti-sigma F factor) [Tissierella praeacuta DSM 18095]SUP01862.1 Anti-sigma F factor [Tissierella praeacuta]